jgi:hypothetical protein
VWRHPVSLARFLFRHQARYVANAPRPCWANTCSIANAPALSRRLLARSDARPGLLDCNPRSGHSPDVGAQKTRGDERAMSPAWLHSKFISDLPLGAVYAAFIHPGRCCPRSTDSPT